MASLKGGKSMMKTDGSTSVNSGNTGVPLKGPSVNSDATRKGVAKTPKTLGPRKA